MVVRIDFLALLAVHKKAAPSHFVIKQPVIVIEVPP